MYHTYNELFEAFKNISEIKYNVTKAFTGFFILVRYFGVKQLENISSSMNDITFLKELIKREKNEISDLLSDLEFDKVLDNIPSSSLSNIYIFMNRHIKSLEIVKDYIESNTFYLLLSENLNEEDFEKVKNNMETYENKLGIFPVHRTDALLITLDNSRKVLAGNLALFYLSANASKVCIISYNNKVFSKNDYETILKDLTQVNKNELIEKLIYIDNPHKHFEFIESVIDKMGKDTFILLVGIEKLVTIRSDNAMSKTFFQNDVINLHTPYSYNWDEFANKLDSLYTKCSSNNILITSIFTLEDDYNPVNSICEASRNFNSYDILSISWDENPLITQTFDFLNRYGRGELEEYEFDSFVNTNKDKLGINNYLLIQGSKELMNNDYLAAENYFKNLTEDAHPFSMLIFASLYINIKEYEKAYKILVKIYDSDKYINGLMPAILETVMNLEENHIIEDWLKKALQINELDNATIQYAANYYTKNKRYSESAEKWEQLFSLTKNVEYKLLSEINKILNEVDKRQVAEIENILEDYAYKYPEIENEVYYKIGLILMEYKKKYNESLKYFLKIDTNITNSYAYNAALERLKIYKDKILKINVTDKKISDESKKIFANELIRDVGILTYKEQSNDRWSQYIDDTFHYEEWKRILLSILLEKICQWSKIEKSLFDETKISVDLNDELLEKIVEIEGEKFLNIEEQETNVVLLLFYSINSVSNGEFQIANDAIFTLFKLAYCSNNDVIKNLSMIFGLTAWSNSNYKMGEEVESMIAMIAAIDLAIQNKEVIYPFMFGFKNVIDFLYNHADMISLDEECRKALNYLVSNIDNEMLKSKYYYIIGEYNFIIDNKLELFKQTELIWRRIPDIEIIFNLKDSEEEFFANEMKVLIDAYYKKGIIKEACFYIDKYKRSIVLNLIEKIDVSYRLFYEWARILLENSNYGLSQEFILLAIIHIEKLRTVFHKRERAFIGKQANEIYRTFMEIICKSYVNCGKSVVDSLSDSLLIRDVLINMVPRSIIEQKLFNRDSSINEELMKFKRRYDDLFFIINNMQQNKKMDENYKNNLSEFLECKKYLEEHHPSFKSLPYYNEMCKDLPKNEFGAIRMKLQDDELFYQVVLVDNLLLYNIISRQNNEINVEVIDLDEYKKMFEAFKENIVLDDYYLCKLEFNEKFIKLCDDFSSIFVKPLYKYLNLKKYKKLYFMPDLNLTYVSMNYMRYKNRWFIELFESIENIIDFNNIGSKSSNNNSDRVVAHFLNKQDKSILKIYNMIKSQKEVEVQESDDLYIQIDQPLKSLILVGHGISEVSGFNYIGAKSIKKSKKININLKEYLDIKSEVKNVIVISCSSGTLINDYAERNNGVWASLLEKNISYILYCKWDVSTEYTNRLLEVVLNKMRTSKNMLLSEALVSAQKEICSNHPVLWAGLEVWKNE